MAELLDRYLTTPAIGKDDLLLIASGSGRTASLVLHAGTAKERMAKIALVTATRVSPIADVADFLVVIPATTPKSKDAVGRVATIQPMGSLFEQALGLTFDVAVILLMRRMDLTSDEMFVNHANLE